MSKHMKAEAVHTNLCQNAPDDFPGKYEEAKTCLCLIFVNIISSHNAKCTACGIRETDPPGINWMKQRLIIGLRPFLFAQIGYPSFEALCGWYVF